MKRKVTRAQQRKVESKRKAAERVAFRIYEPKLKKSRRNALLSAFESIKGAPIDEIPDRAFEALKEPYLTTLLGRMAGQIGAQGAERIESDFGGLAKKAAKKGWEQRVRETYTEQAGERLTEIEYTFKSTVQTKLRNALSTMPNASVEVQTRHLFDTCMAEMGKELWQARRIIQTESLADLAMGERIAMDDLGLVGLKKMWVAAFNNTRPAHAQMHGTVVDKDKLFDMPNGDKMWGPHDMMGGSAENVINCSCGLDWVV